MNDASEQSELESDGDEPIDGELSAGENVPHISVLLNETLELLDLKPGQCAVDGTLGAGGHSAAIIEKLSPGGRLISFDVDPQAIAIAKEKLGPLAAEKKVRHDIVQSNFSDIANVLRNLDAPAPNGIMADLGVSSMQFDTPERGFSFRHDAPLDMRMDPELHETAADILRTASETEIADILYHYGEERASRKIARALVERRKKEPITTTGQLEEFIRYVLRVKRWVRIHPATRTFQALRIAVNHELDVLEMFLKTAPEVLSDNGTLAVITFHSLEDRIAKHTFKGLAATGRFSLPVKFVPPSEAEMAANPRSRSAKLRGLRKEPA